MICVLIIVIIFLVLQDCGGDKGKPDTIEVIDTIKIPGDSVVRIDTIPKDIIKLVEVEVHVPQFMDVDTLAIIMQYFEDKLYEVTGRDDTSMLVRAKIRVWMNELDTVIFETQNRRPWMIQRTIVENYNIEESKFKVYVGVGVRGWTDKFGLSPEVYFGINRKHMIGVGYDVINSMAEFHYGYKLSFRKKKK